MIFNVKEGKNKICLILDQETLKHHVLNLVRRITF